MGSEIKDGVGKEKTNKEEEEDDASNENPQNPDGKEEAEGHDNESDIKPKKDDKLQEQKSTTF